MSRPDPSRVLRVATRGSPLARAQAAAAIRALEEVSPGLACEMVIVKTTGDVESEKSVESAGKGVFVKEIEEKLVAGAVDVAVHSLKDLPTEIPAGLALGAVLPREDARDAFCSREGDLLEELPAGARVATGSARRVAQLRRGHGRLKFVPIRGNVDTRLRKVREGEAEGVVLARAGLVRLGLEISITEVIPLEACLPAPGQGAIGLECREAAADVLRLLFRVHDAESGRAVAAERRFLAALGGGCRVPIAAHAAIERGEMRLRGFVGQVSGTRCVEGTMSGRPEEAEQLGAALAEELLARGAGDLLRPPNGVRS